MNLLKKNGDEHSWSVRLLAKSHQTYGTAQARFRLDLDSPNENLVLVNIRYRILPAIRLLPEALVIWAKQSQQAKRISVTSSEEITRLSVAPEDAEATILGVEIASTSHEGGMWKYLLQPTIIDGNISKLYKARILIAGARFSNEVPVLVIP